MSRMPFPSKLNPSTVNIIARPGIVAICGAVLIYRSPKDNAYPQLGVGGCTPSPIKESVASDTIAVPIPNVATTMIGASAFGMMYLNKILMLLAPNV